MTVLLDINVLLDVVQAREPHREASAAVLSKVVRGETQGLLPGHAVTTIYYLIRRYGGRKRAEEVVDWILASLDVIAPDKLDFIRARALPVSDFEDAVVASLAERSKCDYVVTRNTADFKGSPVSPITPKELLGLL